MLQFDSLPDLQVPVSASYQNQFEQSAVTELAIFPSTPL
jgi:hypothetical protein